MSAKSSKGVTICVAKESVLATAGAMTVTGVAKTGSADIEVTSTDNPADGTLVYFPSASTGTSVDGNVYVVSNTSASKFSLQGTKDDTFTGTFAAGSAKPKHYDTGDMTCLCLSDLSISQDTASTISTGTFCDPSASIASSATAAGSFTFSGYVDTAAADYAELLKLVESTDTTYMRIALPSNGYLVAPVEFSTLTWDIPLDGAVGYSGSGIFKSNLKHRF